MLGEHLRLHPLLRSANQEPYRYEREVEEFLRWSPHVRGSQPRTTPTLSPEQVGELQRLLEARSEPEVESEPVGEDPLAEPEQEPVAAEPPPQPDPGPPPGPPVDHYDDLAAEEVISLLGSLEQEDLLALRAYERDNLGREPVVGAIESVLARRGQHVG